MTKNKNTAKGEPEKADPKKEAEAALELKGIEAPELPPTAPQATVAAEGGHAAEAHISVARTAYGVPAHLVAAAIAQIKERNPGAETFTRSDIVSAIAAVKTSKIKEG